MVDAYHRVGLDAYGCDFSVPADDRLRAIETPYRLPFDDATFDFISSSAVMEHVQDHRVAFAEIRRVLRPDGVSLHVFPARYTPVEEHTFIPAATLVQARLWLRFWAAAGVRSPGQAGWSRTDLVENNRRFLMSDVNYARRSELRSAAQDAGFTIRFVEREAILASTGRAAQLASLLRYAPWLSRVYSGLRARALFLT